MNTKNLVKESSEEEYGLLSSEERDIFSQIAAKEAPYSQRAQALLILNEGATQAEAARQSGLTQGQVRYWLTKFRRDGIHIFPEELLYQAQPMKEDEKPDVTKLELPQNEEDAQQKMRDAEETTGPVGALQAQPEDKSKSKKKSKKKPKKKSKKKSKKTKKVKKEKKPEKKIKKKKPSKKAGGKKGKSGKKKRKNG